MPGKKIKMYEGAKVRITTPPVGLGSDYIEYIGTVFVISTVGVTIDGSQIEPDKVAMNLIHESGRVNKKEKTEIANDLVEYWESIQKKGRFWIPLSGIAFVEFL